MPIHVALYKFCFIIIIIIIIITTSVQVMKPLTELLALPDWSNFHLDQMKLYQQSESRLVADSGSTLLWI